jgi:transposase
VAQLLRTAWRSVGSAVARVAGEARAQRDLLGGLRRIGIDEVSYRKGHRYLTVVVDHDSGRLLWAADGHDEKTLNGFFDALGPQRCAAIELVSADAASWIKNAVTARCPKATLCLDPFHVVSWATDALDAVRRQVWNAARRSGDVEAARDLKGARFALWKNPENLTERQRGRLATIAATNGPLYRAYLLKEQLRQVFRTAGEAGKTLLREWLTWASRSRLPSFVKAARTIRAHRAAIEAALVHRLSNGRVESMNTKLRLITRRSFGFHSAVALIGLAMLSLGGLCPPLPGRS